MLLEGLETLEPKIKEKYLILQSENKSTYIQSEIFKRGNT